MAFVRAKGMMRGFFPGWTTAASMFFLGVLFVCASGPSLAAQNLQEDDPFQEKASPALRQEVQAGPPEEAIRIIVKLNEQANLQSVPGEKKPERQRAVIERLQTRAGQDQKRLRGYLEAAQKSGRASEVEYFWIFNGIALSAQPGLIEELARFPEVDSIIIDEQISLPETPVLTGTVEANIQAVRAPELWALGYRGQGVVVASMDTGVNLYHPDLQEQWRGGKNSWLDVTGEGYKVPVDLLGHGTAVMGVMVGRDEGGTAIGVAPEAKWIAVKIFNRNRKTYTSWIHKGFQWLLDPDGDPATPDAPDVLNNSWSMTVPGCNLEFQTDLQALRAAGILPVFSAGNLNSEQSTGSTDASPGNNPGAFAVGAFDEHGEIWAGSSRGPSACDEPGGVFPEISAPGVSIYSAYSYGYLGDLTGTSLAAPHAAGGLALLLSAFPFLPPELQEQALIQSAADLGEPGPDNAYGYGGLDLMAAYEWIEGNTTWYRQYIPLIVVSEPLEFRNYFPVVLK